MSNEIIYYIHINGQQAGPFPKEKLIEAGMQPNSMVWRSDLPNWVEARTLPELMDLMNGPGPQPFSQGPRPPCQQSPRPDNYPGPGPYQQPYGGGYGPDNGYNQQPRYPAHYPPGWKNWMALAIVGTVLGALCYCIGFVTGLIAIIFSSLANSEAKNGNWDDAKSKNTVAKILTIISLVLGGVGFLIVLVYLIFVGSLIGLYGF